MKQLFIIGAQRSGSTYLYHLLDKHPEVIMAKPVSPEPKFFLDDELSSQGLGLYENTYFKNIDAKIQYQGEKSTSYIENLIALKRINEFYPDARVLIILRNPVLRAWSNYRFSVQNGLESLSFVEALDAEAERLKSSDVTISVNPYAYRKRGYYMEYIDQCRGVFKDENIRIMIFEELVGKLGEVKDLYRWLHINDNFTPSNLEVPCNPSFELGKIPLEASQSLFSSYGETIEKLEKYLGRRIHGWHEYFDTNKNDIGS